MFQMALLLLEDNNCAKLYWNPCINVQVMAQTSSIYDHCDLYLTPVTLTFNLPEKNVSNGTSPPQGQQLCKIILKSMHKCTSCGWDKLNIWPFDLYMTPVTLTLNLPKKNVSNDISPPQGQQLCKIILKSMHKCTSYGPDKLYIWPFWPLFDPCDLDLQTTWKNVSNGTSPPQGQQLCQIVLKSMHYCTSYGPDKSGQTHGWMHWCTHIHRTKIVTIMSRLPASGLGKKRGKKKEI